MGKVIVKGGKPTSDTKPKGDSDVAGQKGVLATPRSEDLLPSLSHITVILENGHQHSFSIAKELALPDDPDELLKAAQHAHERYAFWAYQTERALKKLRAEELKCDDTEGSHGMHYRKWLLDQPEYNQTEGAVKNCLDMNTVVKTARAKANSARYTYGVFRAMRDAMHQRCFIVTRLVGRYVDMDSE